MDNFFYLNESWFSAVLHLDDVISGIMEAETARVFDKTHALHTSKANRDQLFISMTAPLHTLMTSQGGKNLTWTVAAVTDRSGQEVAYLVHWSE